jgi:hypothetical protein
VISILKRFAKDGPWERVDKTRFLAVGPAVCVVTEIGSWHVGIPAVAMVLEMCLLDFRLPSVGHSSDFDIEEICQGSPWERVDKTRFLAAGPAVCTVEAVCAFKRHDPLIAPFESAVCCGIAASPQAGLPCPPGMAMDKFLSMSWDPWSLGTFAPDAATGVASSLREFVADEPPCLWAGWSDTGATYYST